MNHYYRENAKEEYVQEVAHMILGIQRESMAFPLMIWNQVLDFERMKKRIFFRLVSKEKNADLLKKVPYVEWQDLALVFYLKIPEEIVKHATAIIHTNHMERWGVEVEELYRTAKANMEEMPLFFHPIEDFLEGLWAGGFWKWYACAEQPTERVRRRRDCKSGSTETVCRPDGRRLLCAAQ